MTADEPRRLPAPPPAHPIPVCPSADRFPWFELRVAAAVLVLWAAGVVTALLIQGNR